MKSVLFYLFCYNLLYVYNCLENKTVEGFKNESSEYEFGSQTMKKSVVDKRSPEEELGHILTCLTCNNIDTRACSKPLHKFVHTEKCDSVNDRCLSIHTPFGIVTRGCYDIMRKQILYFCACDLCNNLHVRDVIDHIKMGDKAKWARDVADLSHARRLRHSTRRGLKCLSCSVTWSDADDQKSKMRYNACVEGTASFRIGMSTEVCQEKDVCGIRIVKTTGSVVRGCVSGPVYNYFYQFCDKDYCNNDPVVSVYDP